LNRAFFDVPEMLLSRVHLDQMQLRNVATLSQGFVGDSAEMQWYAKKIPKIICEILVRSPTSDQSGGY
jgi:hypothetical protein